MECSPSSTSRPAFTHAVAWAPRLHPWPHCSSCQYVAVPTARHAHSLWACRRRKMAGSISERRNMQICRWAVHLVLTVFGILCPPAEGFLQSCPDAGCSTAVTLTSLIHVDRHAVALFTGHDIQSVENKMRWN